MRLGQKIADLRKKENLSQEGLAEKLNVSRQAVSKWESDQSIPDIEKIVNLSELFGVTTDYLLKSGDPSFDLNKMQNSENKIDNLPIVSDKTINDYLITSHKASRAQAVASASLISAPASFCLIFPFTLILDQRIFEPIAISLAIILGALAVGSFVYAKLILHEFKNIKHQDFDLTSSQRKDIQNRHAQFRSKNIKHLIFASSLCILTILPPVAAFFASFPEFGIWESWGAAFIILALASYQFFTYNTMNVAFLTISKKKHYLSKPDKDRLIYLSLIFWTTIFILCLFLRKFGSWNVSTDYPVYIFYLAIFVYPILFWIYYKQKTE